MNDYTLAIIGLIFLAVVLYLLIRKKKPSHYVSDSVKDKVLERYFYMCALCPFKGDKRTMHFHHRLPVEDGGIGSEENIVPLCPNHHDLITRYNNRKIEE